MSSFFGEVHVDVHQIATNGEGATYSWETNSQERNIPFSNTCFNSCSGVFYVTITWTLFHGGGGSFASSGNCVGAGPTVTCRSYAFLVR